MADHKQNQRHDGNQPNEFIRSVIDLSPDDIVAIDKKKRSLLSFLRDHLRTVIFAVCCAVMVGCGIYILNSLIQYAEAERLYGSLVGQADGQPELMLSSPQGVPTPDYEACQNLTDEDISNIVNSSTLNKEYERVRSRLSALKEKYPDLYGWIVLEGTPINYPIMQSDNNKYYLTHSYKGGKLSAGAIFADYRCNRELMRNYNLVIYGHHMSNNTMFHSLDKFLKEPFFRSNNIIKIYTLDGMFTYKVFSVYQTSMYYQYIRTHFSTREDFVVFANEMRDNSIHAVPDQTFSEGDRLLTLSTCTNRSDDERLAVQAVMIDYYLANSR